MNDSNKLPSPSQLMLSFMRNIKDDASFIEGINPFTIEVNGELIDIYIKKLTTSHSSFSDSDILKIQLLRNDKLNLIGLPNKLFILLGYDPENHVYTIWDPYWCKQNINLPGTISLYSRLSLHKRVHFTGHIEQLDFNNGKRVTCIPQDKIGVYIKNINKYYTTPSQSTNKTSIEVLQHDKQNHDKEISYNKIYEVDEFGKISVLEQSLIKELAKYVIDEEYPNYGKMIEIVRDYYPTEIESRMTDTDWLKLFKLTNFKKFNTLNRKKSESSKVRTKTISVIFPNGTKVQHKFVADTYSEVIQKCYPDLIMELGIKHAGVNIVSMTYDDKYKSFQKKIEGDYLIMTNSSTEQKYQDLCQINRELELGLQINLIDIDSNNIVTPHPIKKNGERCKIKITFPDGRSIQPLKVLDALVDIVNYAGAKKVQDLGIDVNHNNLITNTPYEKYRNAYKPVNDDLYVNTASDTMTKYNQICRISKALNLNLIVELV